MTIDWRRCLSQPVIGIVTSILALTVLTVCWIHGVPRTVDGGTLILAAGLLVALILSYRFPIHLRMTMKLYMGTVALFLMTVLLPPGVAAAGAGLGVAGGTLSVRSRLGVYLSDIATDAGRWILIVSGASFAAHGALLPGAPRTVHLVLAGVILWTGHNLTAPLVFCPISGERPGQVIRALVRESGVTEAGECLVGLLGAMAAAQGRWTLLLLLVPVAVLYRATKEARAIELTAHGLLVHLADAVDLRDPLTGGQSSRVAGLTRQILDDLRAPDPQADVIMAAARIYDIGKLGMPDHVLSKTGELSPGDWQIIRAHPERGAELVLRHAGLPEVATIVRHHHERWDGRGYPRGLAGGEIPFGARVIAVADSFVAMTSDRAYRPRRSPAEALAVLQDGRGVQWDPAVVDALCRVVGKQLDHAVPAPSDG